MRHITRGYVLPGPGMSVSVELEDGETTVIFASGDQPVEGPVDGPCTCKIEAEALKPDLKWPVFIAAVRKEHVEFFTTMSAEMTDKIVDEIGRILRRRAH